MNESKTARILMPLYTRIVKETTRLTDLEATVGSASESRDGGDEFATLYVRRALVELAPPSAWIAIGPLPALQRTTPRRKRVRRELNSLVSQIATRLDALHGRLDADALNDRHGTETRLAREVRYYRLALQVVARSIEPMSHGAGTATPAYQAVRLLAPAVATLDRFLALGSAAVGQYDERLYLAGNPDVRAAVAERKLVSGMEHFALHGVHEVVAGRRTSPGIDPENLQLEAPAAASPADADAAVAALSATGLVEIDWYAERHGVAPQAALADYCGRGWREGRAPNRVFDQDWYRARHPDAPDDVPALVHYATVGEPAGAWPAECFDPRWYRARHGLAANGPSPLAHYLGEGRAAGLNPNAVFDAAYYLRRNPDVAEAGMDPVEHFYGGGWREGRNPSASFDLAWYVKHELGGDTSVNPVTHFLEREAAKGVASPVVIDDRGALDDRSMPGLANIAANIRHFANAGPGYEEPSPVGVAGLEARARTIAFYLPQFHAFEQNDAWWGKGFSEWRNVARGTPRFAGHYQPRIPRDLGFYDLNDVSVMHEQARLAAAAGISAFCFYYYWFDGTRLMDAPLERFLDEGVDRDFCIMWANENWTRTWDGLDAQVLIEQSYRDEDEAAFIADTARYLGHERYVRVDGRPLFILYRPGLLPEAAETLSRWRTLWTEALGVEPWILMVQGFGDEDPRAFGLDGAVEFPPHKVCVGVEDMNAELTVLDPGYAGQARRYSDVVAKSLGEGPVEFPLIKTVVPSWDNDARREGRGMTLHGSTPELYERWLGGAIEHARRERFGGEALVFVNAWNEWAEGAYLEPDVHWGHAYLNATRRAVHGLTRAGERGRILLVGHDAHRHGAQMLLLNLARVYREQFGMEVVILLKEGGALLDDYRRFGRTVVLESLGIENLPGLLARESLDVAIANTTVTGDLVPVLHRSGLKVVSLIHELPNLVEEYGLQSRVADIARDASHVVFPSEIVRRGFHRFCDGVAGEERVRPQGTYKRVEFDAEARAERRREIGIAPDDKVVLNVGYADLRKGFDLFLHTARAMVRERPDVHFVWVGALAEDMRRWVGSDLERSEAGHRVHLVGFSEDMAGWYSAADALFLTSREDPYPTVVLEAMNVGLPVVLYEGATGFDEVISRFGRLVDRNDPGGVERGLVQALYNDSRAARTARVTYVETECRHDEYAFALLRMLRPDLAKVSVVVPNYNYERYIGERLGSVFEQDHPVFEVLVLDDRSPDDSVAVIERTAREAGRSVRLVVNEENSGNVFRQWRRGVDLARGELLWIAEADDLAAPDFLARHVEAHREGIAISACDSVQIDTDGKTLATSYDYYLDQIDPTLFRSDFAMSGEAFVRRALAVKNVLLNVSSIVWSRQALDGALRRVGPALEDLRLVGDWRLYLEALSSRGGDIAWIAESLNVHRRHPQSVTHSMDHRRHLNEIEAMHTHVRAAFGTDPELDERIGAYVEELRVQFRLKLAGRQRRAA